MKIIYKVISIIIISLTIKIFLIDDYFSAGTIEKVLLFGLIFVLMVLLITRKDQKGKIS